MKTGTKGRGISLTHAIKKIIIHDFLKFNRIENKQRKNLIKKKLLFLNLVKDYETIECPICMEKIKKKERAITYCGHSFCFDCIKNVYNNYSHKCPMCREELNNKKIFLISS
tara:strand:- start:13 stop:348 length:336 start_codon:yes stop_codon:yes gene_type:complete